MKEQFQEIKNGILVIFLYFLTTEFIALPFQLLHIETASLPAWIKLTYTFLIQLGLIAIIIYLFRDSLKSNLKDLKENHKSYFEHYFKYWFLILGLMMISNLLIQTFTPSEIAGNEEAVRNSFQATPIYMFITAVFIAPVLEELVFRKAIRNLFPTKVIFILVSGIVFGSLHVLTSITNYYDLFYIIPYSIPGVIFAYLFVKTDNIFVPISMHFLHNGILMSLQVALLLLG